MVYFAPLAAEINLVVWGITPNFNEFRVLAALLHGTPVVGVSQTLSVEQRAPPMFGRATTLGIAHILVFVTNLINIELTDALRTKWHCSMPKIIQIGPGVVKM